MDIQHKIKNFYKDYLAWRLNYYKKLFKSRHYLHNYNQILDKTIRLDQLIFRNGVNFIISDANTARQTFEEIFINEDYKLPHIFKSKIVIDIGANIGLFTLYVRYKSPNSKIFSIEPDPYNYKILSENVRINPVIKGVNCFNLAIFGDDKKTSFFCNSISGWSSLFPLPGTEEIKINTICFSNFCNSQNIDKVDFLKIDAEGAEYDIILGDKEFFNILVKEIYLEVDNSPRDNRYEFNALVAKLRGKYNFVKIIKNKNSNWSLIHCKKPKYF